MFLFYISSLEFLITIWYLAMARYLQHIKDKELSFLKFLFR